mmetsp:Transcript_137554/g.252942  ORF Transcript_137554/g.252942 Transcript_137554/m.252942 type:complete len:224 (+) Transcript_137554:139-810(+)
MRQRRLQFCILLPHMLFCHLRACSSERLNATERRLRFFEAGRLELLKFQIVSKGCLIIRAFGHGRAISLCVPVGVQDVVGHLYGHRGWCWWLSRWYVSLVSHCLWRLCQHIVSRLCNVQALCGHHHRSLDLRLNLGERIRLLRLLRLRRRLQLIADRWLIYFHLGWREVIPSNTTFSTVVHARFILTPALRANLALFLGWRKRIAGLPTLSAEFGIWLIHIAT